MITVGNPAIVELPSIPGWNPQTGPITTRIFRGREEDIRAFGLQLRQQGYRYEPEMEPEGMWWTVKVYVGNEGNEEPLSDAWDLKGSDLDKSVWELPEITAVTHADLDPTSEGALTLATNMRQFRGAVTAFVEGRRTIETDNGEVVDLNIAAVKAAAATVGLDQGAVMRLVIALLRGVDTWQVSAFVLHRRVIIGLGSRFRPNKANLNRIFTVTQLRLLEGLPEDAKLSFDVPEGVYKKMTPTVTQISADKWAADFEYWHADSYDPLTNKKAVG